MQAFVLERLYPSGWRRTGELFWRLSDAQLASRQAISDEAVRAVRILSARINPDAVIEMPGGDA